MQPNIEADIIANANFGGSLLAVKYHIPQNPILIIKVLPSRVG